MIRFGFILVLMACTAGCDANLPGKPDPKNRPLPAESVLSFDALYQRNCSGCHGKDGTQGPAPPLNDLLFRALIPLDELEKAINRGRPGTEMPAFAKEQGGTLSPEQIKVLVFEIKGTSYRVDRDRSQPVIVADAKGIVPQWGAVPAAPPSAPPYVATATGSADQGAKIFARACATCHGDNGQGVVKQDKRWNKINEPAFLSLISDQALRRIIITGRGDLHMPDFSQKAGRPDNFQPLSTNDVSDLVALLAAWRQATPVSGGR